MVPARPRLRDHPALIEAAAAEQVVALFVLDPRLLAAGGPRVAYLLATVQALATDLRGYGGELVLRTGDPAEVVPQVMIEAGAEAVHISAEHTPYGAARDARVQEALGAVPLVTTGSPYAVTPGRIRKTDGDPYRVFTPFHSAWLDHGWPAPAHVDPAAITWRRLPGEDIPAPPPHTTTLPLAGERAALHRWQEFCADGLEHYEQDRDRPDRDGTSRMSAHLKFGTIHPRTMLADLSRRGTQAAAAYRRQLCWREFYGAVLHHWPDSAHGYFQPAMAQMTYDTGPDADEAFVAWAEGRTGFPIVDAGMRQHLPADLVHHPWDAPDGVPSGYSEPIVDHAVQRRLALDRYAAVRGR